MKTIRTHLLIFISLLVLSGITAFPLKTEMLFLYNYHSLFPDFMDTWISKVYISIMETPNLVLYGTDWLAFAHIVIALFFIPVYQQPQLYKANLKVGLWACVLIFPLAFICGPIRGIPFFHQLIDCSFGLLGGIYLYFILQKINKLSNSHENNL